MDRVVIISGDDVTVVTSGGSQVVAASVQRPLTTWMKKRPQLTDDETV